MHVGRSWEGREIEDACPCPKEPCGLVDQARAVPECDEHHPSKACSIRQSHPGLLCPRRPADPPAGGHPRHVDEHAHRIGADAPALDGGRASAIVLGALARHGLAVVAIEDLDIVMNQGDQAAGWPRYSAACDRLRAAIPNPAPDPPAPDAPKSPPASTESRETLAPGVPQPPDRSASPTDDHSGMPYPHAGAAT